MAAVKTIVGFGGGCHWCTEAVFQTLKGVEQVEQGFIASEPPDDSLSEAVRVTFDEAQIPLSVLIEIHLRTHASTSNHTMRGKYRSAVYAADADLLRDAQGLLTDQQSLFDVPLVTRALPLVRFKASPERFQNYRNKRPEAPFCKAYIDPKLALLRQQFSERFRGDV